MKCFGLKFVYFDEKIRKFLVIYRNNKDIFLLKNEVESLKKQYKLNSYDIYAFYL